MKKFVAFLLCLIFALSFCACAKKDEAKDNEKPQNTVSDTSSSEEPKTVPLPIAKELFDRNLKCNLEIFDLDTLPYEETAFEGTFNKVTDERFTKYSELEDYVKSTYTEDAAQTFLGRGLYKDVNGVFCIDTNKIGGKGYYVDWSDYDIAVLSGDENEAEISVRAVIIEPSDNPTPESYEKKAKLKKVDGEWLLTEVIY